MLDTAAAWSRLDGVWGDAMGPLCDYIRVPCKSPAFDPHWQAHGHMERAVAVLEGWCRSRPIDGMVVDVVRLPGRTPLLLVDVPAHGAADPTDTVVLYGHLDKQPEFDGWGAGLGPWEPVLDGDRLYGRGGADDGYSVFAALGAIEAVRAAGGSHARCVVLIEASEESGSPDLAAHLDALAGRLGSPSLVVCLDSGCQDYDRLWVTTSLRGLVACTVRVRVLTAGAHSGGSGPLASSFRVLRILLDRVEDAGSGRVLLPEFHVEVPPERQRQAAAMAADAGLRALALPVVAGMRYVADDVTELVLARTWRPAVSVTGAEGLPALESAGNVLRPFTALRLSVRVPPTADAGAALAALTGALTKAPPFGAEVEVVDADASAGWDAPATAPWLEAALAQAAQVGFGRPPGHMGEGGTIPLLAMLGRRFPEAQFVVTGVIGPDANAHGPNESLHLPTARRVSAAVAVVLDGHGTRPR